MAERSAFRCRLEAGAMRLAVALFTRLPERWAYAVGGGMGRVAGAILPSRRRVAREAMARAFPDWPPERVGETMQEHFLQLGWTLAEFFRVEKTGPDWWRERITTEGGEHLVEALSPGRGVIFLSAHFGNWELLGGAARERCGVRMTAVAKPMKNLRVDRIINGIRQSRGIDVVSHRASFGTLLKALKGNSAVGILLDQHTAPHEAVLCTFFGRPAATSYGLALLAAKSGAPVLPAFLVREGRGRHRLVFLPPVRFQDEAMGGLEAAMIAFTQRCTTIIEEMVRRHPEQWFWVHRRWKAETHLDQFSRRAAR